eukprot:7258165-Prymnesium_polylepis.1
MFVQPDSLSDVSCGHAAATAVTAASVMLLQPDRLSDVSCGHAAATAVTAASVMFLQMARSSDVSSAKQRRAALRHSTLRRGMSDISSLSGSPSPTALVTNSRHSGGRSERPSMPSRINHTRHSTCHAQFCLACFITLKVKDIEADMLQRDVKAVIIAADDRPLSPREPLLGGTVCVGAQCLPGAYTF